MDLNKREATKVLKEIFLAWNEEAPIQSFSIDKKLDGCEIRIILTPEYRKQVLKSLILLLINTVTNKENRMGFWLSLTETHTLKWNSQGWSAVYMTERRKCEKKISILGTVSLIKNSGRSIVPIFLKLSVRVHAFYNL